MNLLVLTPLIPYPPHDGDKLRLFRFLEYLRRKGHTLDLFCLTRAHAELEQVEGLRHLCRRIHTQVLTKKDLFFNLIGSVIVGRSLNVGMYFSPELRDSLRAYWKTQEGKSIDVVLAHRLRMAPAAFEGNPGKPVVLELTDCLSDFARQTQKTQGVRFRDRWMAMWNRWFLPSEEINWSGLSFKTILTTDSEVRKLAALGADAKKLEAIPNGVQALKSRGKPQGFPKTGPVLCFLGSMAYGPNEQAVLWFVNRVWGSVRKAYPSASFLVVGTGPTERVKALDGREGIRVTGWVPEVEPYLIHSDLSVAPLRIAAGMQNKVALAMALGKPVVASSQALAWLPEKDRSLVSIGDDPDSFLSGVLSALKKPNRAGLLKAKAFIIRNYRWDDAGRRLEAILKKAAQGGM